MGAPAHRLGARNANADPNPDRYTDRNRHRNIDANRDRYADLDANRKHDRITNRKRNCVANRKRNRVANRKHDAVTGSQSHRQPRRKDRDVSIKPDANPRALARRVANLNPILIPDPNSSSCLSNPLSLSEERVRERFHATYTSRLVQPPSMAASLAWNLSRRDRNSKKFLGSPFLVKGRGLGG